MSVTLHELLEAVYSEDALSWVGDVEPSWLLKRLGEIMLPTRDEYTARYDIGDTDIEIRAHKADFAEVDFLLNEVPRLRMKLHCCPIDSWEVVQLDAVGDDGYAGIIRSHLANSINHTIQAVRRHQF